MAIKQFLENYELTPQDDCDLSNAMEKSHLVYAQIYREFRRVMRTWMRGDIDGSMSNFMGFSNIDIDYVALESIIEDMTGTNLCNEWESFKEALAEREEREAIEDAKADAAHERYVERGERMAKWLEDAA